MSCTRSARVQWHRGHAKGTFGPFLAGFLALSLPTYVSGFQHEPTELAATGEVGHGRLGEAMVAKTGGLRDVIVAGTAGRTA